MSITNMLTNMVFDPWYTNTEYLLHDIIFDTNKKLDNWPKINIFKNNNNIVLQMAVPGLSKDQITIDISDNILTISSKVEKDITEDKANVFYVAELKPIQFTRKFRLYNHIIDNLDKITSSLNNGILEIVIALKKDSKPLSTKIEIE